VSRYKAEADPRIASPHAWKVVDTETNQTLLRSNHAHCINYASDLNRYDDARAKLNEILPPLPVQAQPDPMGDLLQHALVTFADWEIPLYALGTRVIHKPSGVECVVKAYCAWEPPVIIYGLEQVNGPWLPSYSHASDIALVVPVDSAHDGGDES
jgi:hypothetical protein